jgi:uncharacterized protein YlzI (FlbEa/FlbD family)
MVLESAEEIIERVVRFRRSIVLGEGLGANVGNETNGRS